MFCADAHEDVKGGFRVDNKEINITNWADDLMKGLNEMDKKFDALYALY